MTVDTESVSAHYWIEKQPLPSRRQRLACLRRAFEIECGGHGLHH
jgi:hypothetical protein